VQLVIYFPSPTVGTYYATTSPKGALISPQTVDDQDIRNVSVSTIDLTVILSDERQC